MEPDINKQHYRKILIRSLVGCLVFGLSNVVSNKFLLPSAPFIAFRPQIALPMFMGIVYGPWTGFITGFADNMLGEIGRASCRERV